MGPEDNPIAKDMGHSGFVNAVCFDESGQVLLTASIEGAVCIWDVDRRQLIDRFGLHDGPINALTYHRGVIVTAGWDGAVRVTSRDGKPLREYRLEFPVHAVAYLEQRVIFGGSDGRIYFANGTSTDMATVESEPGHVEALECLAIADTQLVSGSRDGTVSIRPIRPGGHGVRLPGHSAWVTQIVSDAPGRAISVGEDGLVIGWDLVARRAQWQIDLGVPIWGLAVDRAAQRAIVGAAGPPLVLDLETRTIEAIGEVDGFAARAIDVSAGGLVALGHDGGGVEFLPRGECAPTQRIPGRHHGILTAAFHEHGWVTGHQDGTVTFAGPDARPAPRQARESMAYAATRLGQGQVAIGGLDHRITIWDTSRQELVATLDHQGQVFSLDRPNDASVLLSVGDDHWIQWETSTWQVVARQDAIGSGNHTLGALSNDGRLVAIVGEDSQLRLWRDRRAADSFSLPTGDSSAVALDPSGDCAYVAFNDGTVIRMALTTGESRELHRLHDSWIRQLLVSADGQRVLSCSQNGIAVACDLGSGTVTRLGDEPIAAIGLTPRDEVNLLSCSGVRHESPTM